MLTLRNYQLDGVEKLRSSYRSGKRAPLYVLPTGGGKTAVFSYIAQNAVSRGKRVSILVHRHELLQQASLSLSRLDVKHGLMSPRFAQSQEPVQVASVQTLVRRLDRVQKPDLVVVDEAHHALASTYRKILDAFGSQVLGVTATPCRSDGAGLGEIFDDIVVGPSIADLIRDGFLVRPEIYAPPVGIDLTGVKRKMGDYDKKELSNRIDKAKITGDCVDHYTRLCAGQPGIAFCVSIQHAEHVADAFRQRGYRALRVDGAMDDLSRRRAIEGLGNGSVDVLCSAELIGEGVDIPKVSVAILLRPTHSTALYLQQVGRALRPFEGKTKALILDHVGNVMRHGFPDDDREWSLHGAARRGKRESEDLIKIEQCDKCYFVFERGPSSCPACGHEGVLKARQIETTEGELVKLSKEQIEANRLKARREVGTARTIEELIEIGRQRNYKNPRWWAEKVLNGRRRAG